MIKSNDDRQIFSVSSVYVQGVRVVPADFPGKNFTINGVGLFTPFIRDDHEGDAPIGPKCLVSCSSHVFTRGNLKGYEIDNNLNVQTDLSLKTTKAVGGLKNSFKVKQEGLTS